MCCHQTPAKNGGIKFVADGISTFYVVISTDHSTHLFFAYVCLDSEHTRREKKMLISPSNANHLGKRVWCARARVICIAATEYFIMIISHASVPHITQPHNSRMFPFSRIFFFFFFSQIFWPQIGAQLKYTPDEHRSFAISFFFFSNLNFIRWCDKLRSKLNRSPCAPKHVHCLNGETKINLIKHISPHKLPQRSSIERQ